MSQTYVIGDLHGRFDLLEMALAKIADHAERPATIVTLGDYVDRGPDSRQVIERLMDGLDGGWRLICLKGNHEDIMWQTCCGIVPDYDWWLTNGGGATLISYGQGQSEKADVTIVPDEHLSWIERLPLMHVDEHRIFVHAGVDPKFSLDRQDPQEVMWRIYDDRDEGGHGQRHVVHGHHQHVGPILRKNRTNLDTFAWYTGRLVIGVFDDDTPGGPVEILQARGQPIGAIRAAYSMMTRQLSPLEILKARGQPIGAIRAAYSMMTRQLSPLEILKARGQPIGSIRAAYSMMTRRLARWKFWKHVVSR